MRIPRGLPTFNDEHALIIVCSTREATMYRAYQGTLEKITDIVQLKVRYSDREGHFRSRGRGIVVRSGAPYTNRDETNLKRLANKLDEVVKKIYRTKTVDTVYVSAPKRHLRELGEALPAMAQKDIVDRIPGNFHDLSVTEVLERIKWLRDRRRERRIVKPRSEEAQRLRSKSL